MFIKKMQRNPDGGDGGGDGQTSENNPGGAFNPETFKQEILEQNRQLFAQLSSGISQTIESAVSEKLQDVRINPPQVTPQSNSSVDDFATEFAAMGIEDEEVKTGMLAMFNKLAEKRAPELSNAILNNVNNNLNTRDAKQAAEQGVITDYPDCLDPSTPLFKQAKIEMQGMSQTFRGAPDSQAIAVRLAAAKLGMAPRSRQQILSNNAGNPTNSDGSGGGKGKNEISKETLDLAESFGLKKDIFKARLLAKRNKEAS